MLKDISFIVSHLTDNFYKFFIAFILFIILFIIIVRYDLSFHLPQPSSKSINDNYDKKK